VHEVWIEDLTTDTLLVFRDPAGNTYRSELTLKPGDSVSPQTFPQLVLSVTSLLNLDLGE
jgi:Uma2 family endonuclease